MDSPITGQVVESAGARYGLLGIGIVILGFVVIWIVKRYLAVNDAIGKEREAMVKEREQTIARDERIRIEHNAALAAQRAEFAVQRIELEKKHEAGLREYSEQLRKELQTLMRESRDNEATIRRDNADLLEKLEASGAQSALRTSTVLEKLADRITLAGRRAY